MYENCHVHHLSFEIRTGHLPLKQTENQRHLSALYFTDIILSVSAIPRPDRGYIEFTCPIGILEPTVNVVQMVRNVCCVLPIQLRIPLLESIHSLYVQKRAPCGERDGVNQTITNKNMMMSLVFYP